MTTQHRSAQFASAWSSEHATRDALDAACREATERLGASADLAFAFFSHHYAADAELIAAEISRICGAKVLLGATGETIVGNAREIEDQPAIAVWLAKLPGATLFPMHLEFNRTPEGGTFVGWHDELGETWPEGATLFLLADPFTFPADALLERLNEDRPGLPALGGMASGAHTPGRNRLLLGRNDFSEGAAAVLAANVDVEAVVSQGCRPIGRPMVITRAERNVIFELGGMPAMTRLREIYEELADRDRVLLQNGLHVGRVINEYQERFDRGDFLIRNCIGADSDSGAIAVGDYVRAGQTVQFHIRDAASADEDLRELLSTAASAGDRSAALLFTCNGRGTRLFDERDHDAAAIQQVVGPIPTAGFFAQGEIGPVSGKNFLHGFTASVALFGGTR